MFLFKKNPIVLFFIDLDKENDLVQMDRHWDENTKVLV